MVRTPMSTSAIVNIATKRCAKNIPVWPYKSKLFLPNFLTKKIPINAEIVTEIEITYVPCLALNPDVSVPRMSERIVFEYKRIMFIPVNS